MKYKELLDNLEHLEFELKNFFHRLDPEERNQSLHDTLEEFEEIIDEMKETIDKKC